MNTSGEFARVDSDSDLSLAGSLLSAGSALNIATDPTDFGDLLDIRTGGQLVMNSADPVVLLTGGTHSVGTNDATANNTANRLFNLRGVNTDAAGLGTDRPIRGDGVDPAPFAGAANPVGTLFGATDGADMTVRQGAGDTSGGTAILLDTALLEASLPVFDLVGSAATESKLTTDGRFADIARSRVVALGPVIALDKGLITVNDGPLLNLRNGSTMTVTGDLTRLTNGSTINVLNGPAIRVSGAGTTLNVSGALLNFGNTNGNTFFVNNPTASNATRGGPLQDEINVSITGVGSTITIGDNPIINDPGGNTFQTGGAVIEANNGGTVNITAP